MVLDGCAREPDPKVRLQPPHRSRPPRGDVLDRVRLVEDQRGEAYARQHVRVARDDAIPGDDEVPRFRVDQQKLTVDAAIGQHPQTRREACGLRDPARRDRDRRDHQRRPERRAVHEQGQGLHRLAEAHVVREAGPGSPRRQAREPAIALELVGPQIGVQPGRERWLEGSRGGGPFTERAPCSIGGELFGLQLGEDGGSGDARLEPTSSRVDQLRRSREVLAELRRQADEHLRADGHVAPALRDRLEQRGEGDAMIVDLDPALDAEQTVPLGDADTELHGRRPADPAPRSRVLRPLDDDLRTQLGKRLDDGEARVLTVHAVAPSPLPGRPTERRESHDALRRRTLFGKVAAHRDVQPVHRPERETGPLSGTPERGPGDGTHADLHEQPDLALRREPHDRPAVGTMKLPGEFLGEVQLDRVLQRPQPTTKLAVALRREDRLVTLERLDQRQHRGPERRQRDDPRLGVDVDDHGRFDVAHQLVGRPARVAEDEARHQAARRADELEAKAPVLHAHRLGRTIREAHARMIDQRGEKPQQPRARG